jgi:hypothetical protein
MTPIEQESLLLRQIVALRRRGWSHDRALEHTRSGLPEGELLKRVEAAQRELAAGSTEAPDLLARGDAPVETLERGAAALEARASAASALSLMQLYVSIAVAGPLVLGSLLGWLVGSELYAMTPPPMRALAGVLLFLEPAGLPIAFVSVGFIRWAFARALPTSRIERGARLFDSAARGDEPEDLIRGPVEQAYFVTRRSAVGAAQAMEELATELVREGEGLVRLFRHLAPVVGAAVAILLVWPALSLVTFVAMGSLVLFL